MTPLLPDPLPPYDFLASQKEAFESQGFDFEETWEEVWNTGWTFKGPNWYLQAIEDPDRLDAWLIWWAEFRPKGSPLVLLQTCLKFMPYHKPYVGLVRRLKGKTEVKYYSTDRLINFTPEE